MKQFQALNFNLADRRTANLTGDWREKLHAALISLEQDADKLAHLSENSTNTSPAEADRLRRAIRGRLGWRAAASIVRFQNGWHEELRKAIDDDRQLLAGLGSEISGADAVGGAGNGDAATPAGTSKSPRVEVRCTLAGVGPEEARRWVESILQLDSKALAEEREFLRLSRRELRRFLPEGSTILSAALENSPGGHASREAVAQRSNLGERELTVSAPAPDQPGRRAIFRIIVRFAGMESAAQLFVRQLQRAVSLGDRDKAGPTMLHRLDALLAAWLQRPGRLPWKDSLQAIATGKIGASTLAELSARREELGSLPNDQREMMLGHLRTIVRNASWEDVMAHAPSVVSRLQPAGQRRTELASGLCAHARGGTIHEVRTVLVVLAEAGGPESASCRYARAFAFVPRFDKPVGDVGWLLNLVEEKSRDAEPGDAYVAQELAVAGKREQLAQAIKALRPLAAARRALSGNATSLLRVAAKALANELPAPPIGVWQTAKQQSSLHAAIAEFKCLWSDEPDGEWKLDRLSEPLPHRADGEVDRHPAAWWQLARGWLGCGAWTESDEFDYALEVADGSFTERWLNGEGSLGPLAAWIEKFLGAEAGHLASLVASRWVIRRFDEADDSRDADRFAALREWLREDSRAEALAHRWKLPAGASALRDRWRGCVAGSLLAPRRPWEKEWITLLWRERLAAANPESASAWSSELARWPSQDLSEHAWEVLLTELAPHILASSDAGDLIANLAEWGRSHAIRGADLPAWRLLLEACPEIGARPRHAFLLALLGGKPDTARDHVRRLLPSLPRRFCLDLKKTELTRFHDLCKRLSFEFTLEDGAAVVAGVREGMGPAMSLDDRYRAIELLAGLLPGGAKALVCDFDFFEGFLAELLLNDRSAQFAEIKKLTGPHGQSEAAGLRVARRVLEQLAESSSNDPKPLALLASQVFPARKKAWKAIAREKLPHLPQLRLARSLFTTPKKRVVGEIRSALLREATLLHETSPDRAARLTRLISHQVTTKITA